MDADLTAVDQSMTRRTRNTDTGATARRTAMAKPRVTANGRPLARWVAVTALCFAAAVAAAGEGDTLGKSVAVEGRSQQEAARSQAKVDALADQTAQLAERYKTLLAKVDNLQAYDDQVEKLVASQRRQVQSLTQQLAGIDVTEQRILPFVGRMLATLDEFVKLDVPFLPDERKKRLQQLHSMMDDAGVSVAEKYRRVMEAYQVETDYGRTIEAYRGKLRQSGGERLVDFLRIGRVALLYRTLDGSDSGYWDQRRRQWISTGARGARAVAKGLRIARKERAPDLIDVPVPAPETESGHD